MSNIRIRYTLFSLLSILIISCKSSYDKNFTKLDRGTTFHTTDYSKLDHWAAHPEKEDPADRIPNSKLLRDQSELKADVFFIHPTTLTDRKGATIWNASISDIELNNKTDESTILSQASIFNKAGKIYAPRYQQAHLFSYYTKDTLSGKEALNRAYLDVKAAFQYYLKHYNKNRPFIIASHSQGTTHAKKLIAEFIDGKGLQKQLVAAYIIGIPVLKKQFNFIQPCESENDIGCIISWRTYRKDVSDKKLLSNNTVLATNPLSWKTDSVYVSKTMNKGAILWNFNKIYPQLVDAQVDYGVLKVNKPKFPGSFFFRTKNYHIGDLNFFYFNIQENATTRVQSYFEETN